MPSFSLMMFTQILELKARTTNITARNAFEQQPYQRIRTEKKNFCLIYRQVSGFKSRCEHGLIWLVIFPILFLSSIPPNPGTAVTHDGETTKLACRNARTSNWKLRTAHALGPKFPSHELYWKFISTNYNITLPCRRTAKISWTDRVLNVLHRVKDSSNIVHTTNSSKAKWIGHILIKNCLLNHFSEGKIERIKSDEETKNKKNAATGRP